MSKGKLYGVSVGPGDPELLTLRAVRAIREADVVAVPNIGHKRQTAYTIAQEFLQDKCIVDCDTPMTRDRSVVNEAYNKIADTLGALLDEGKDVAYLTLGDVTVYSTYIYIHNIMKERGYQAEIIPGVTSFCAVAAKLGISLCEGPDRLMIAPVLASNTDDVLDISGTKVFMKSGRAIVQLRDKLAQRGMLENASMVSNCGLPEEQVFPQMADMNDDADYFSVVIVKDPKESV